MKNLNALSQPPMFCMTGHPTVTHPSPHTQPAARISLRAADISPQFAHVLAALEYSTRQRQFPRGVGALPAQLAAATATAGGGASGSASGAGASGMSCQMEEPSIAIM
jgi:hypothetical protein